MDLNKVMLIGNIVSDPEVKTTPSGQNVASFRMATNRRWKDKQTGELKEDAQFHNIVAWGGLSDIISKYAGKGKKIYLEGRLTHRSYDGQDGQKKYWTEVVAENIILLGVPSNTNNNFNQQIDENASNDNGNITNTTPSNTDQNKQQEDTTIPPTEEIPTINIDDDKDEIKVEDIPF